MPDEVLPCTLQPVLGQSMPSPTPAMPFWPTALPVTVHESWQQGLFVGEFKPDGRAFGREHVAIRHGWSLWRGTEYGTPA